MSDLKKEIFTLFVQETIVLRLYTYIDCQNILKESFFVMKIHFTIVSSFDGNVGVVFKANS